MPQPPLRPGRRTRRRRRRARSVPGARRCVAHRRARRDRAAARSERCRQDHAAAVVCRACSPVERGAGPSSASIWRRNATSVRPHVGLLGHQNGLYLDLTVARERPVLGRDRRRDRRRDRGRDGADGRRGSSRRRAGPQAVGRPEAPHVTGLPGRPPSAGLAARRAACRARRRGRDELDDTLRAGRRRRCHDPRRQSRARTGRIAGDSHRRGRRWAGACTTPARDPIGISLGTAIHEYLADRPADRGKDLRIERRSRVVTNQVLPFAGITMVIFAFALDADSVLDAVAPGLVWLATMFSLLVLVQRSFAVETDDGALDAMRVAGVDARAIYLGKAIGLGVATPGARSAAAVRCGDPLRPDDRPSAALCSSSRL